MLMYDKDMQIVDTFMTPLNENGRAQRFPVGVTETGCTLPMRKKTVHGGKVLGEKIGESTGGRTITLTGDHGSLKGNLHEVDRI